MVNRKTKIYTISDPAFLKQQMLYWANRYNICCLLDSNEYVSHYSKLDCILAVDPVRLNRAGAIWGDGLRDLIGHGAGREDFSQQARQLAPLGVAAAAAHRQGMLFEPCQGFNFHAQLGDGARGGGLVEDFFLGGFDFVVGCFVQIFHIVAIEGRQGRRQDRGGLSRVVQHLQFAQPAA